MCLAAAPLATMALATTVAGGVVTAVGQVNAGKADRDRQKYLAAVDRNNAVRNEYLAEDAIDRGQIDESRQRLRGRLLIGQMRAVLGGSGQVVDSGSAAELVQDQTVSNEEGARIIRNNAEREAQGFRLRASDLESTATLRESAGEDAEDAGYIRAGGTLLGTGGTVANKWYQYKRAGVF